MLNIRQKKTPLTAVFPEGYIDIHSHLLPGIDDGAKDLENSIQMILKMRSYGIKNFITTPHISETWPNTSEIIKQKLAKVQQELVKQNITDVSISAAAEHKLDDRFNNLLKAKKLLTLKDNYVLVELGFFNAPLNLYEVLFEMQLAGYKPVLAHPERYSYYYDDFSQYHKLKRSGCLFQLDLLSLVGHYGDQKKKIAIKMLADGLIDFAGTDAHNDYHLELLKDLGVAKITKMIKPVLAKNSFFKDI